MKKIFINKNKIFFSIILLIAAISLNFIGNFLKTPLEADELRFHAINVGQGDSFLFVFPKGETVLIDAGTKENGLKVVKYLEKNSVEKIDILVATHPHSDHIGGMESVLDNFTIKELWDSGYNRGSPTQLNFYKKIREKNIAFITPKRGYNYEIGGGKIEVLAPERLLKNTRSDANNNSIVIKITYGKTSFLLTGDMEHEERNSIPPLPHATILKAAHHGSHNGISNKMLKEISPQFIIFSYGENNSYGHPSKKTLKLLKNKSNIIRLDTAKGDILIKTDGESVKYSVSCEVKPIWK
ncbi:MAG: MBL fold metallo-hydrolase [Synergistaceae bacterium]